MSKVSLLPLLTILAVSIGASSLNAATPRIFLSPSSGSGQSQVFTLSATDSDGAADIDSVDLLFNTVFDGESGCWIFWNNTAGQAFFNTDGLNWAVLASGATLENSRCAVQYFGSSASGNEISVSFGVSFKTPLAGALNMWTGAWSSNAGGTGYQQTGTWTVPATAPVPDFQVSMSPVIQTVVAGGSQTYSVAVTSLNGYTGNVQLAASTVPAQSGVTVTASGTNGTSIFVPAGGTGYGSIVASTTTAPTTSLVTIAASLTDGTLAHTATAALGIMKPPSTPLPSVSATVTTIAGPLQAFVVTATDLNGYAAINGVNLLINSTFNGQNACWLYFAPGQNGSGTLSLASDDASTWTSMTLPIEPGSTSQLQNTQCIVGGGPITASGSGNTLTLTIPLTLSAALRGALTMWARAGDAEGDSGYQNVGSLTLPGATSPDFALGYTPATQTIVAGGQANWQVTINPEGGYTGSPSVSVTGLPPGAMLNGAPAIVNAGKSLTFSVTAASDTPAGNYPLTITATDGLRTHSASVTLVVESSAIPVLSPVYNPLSANSPVTLHYAATSPSGAAPAGLNVLIAGTVDGSHACWLFYNGQLSLASDDGTAWLMADSSGNAANSQCSVHLVSTDSQSGELGMWVNITPLGQFATSGKNIYLSAYNQAGSTGYQLLGHWQMP